MKNLTIALILLLTTSAFAQKTFDLKDASKYFDIKVKLTKCDDDTCTGPATFTFYKKGGTTPYQTISLSDTYADVSNGGQPLVNTTVLYDQQSLVNIDDYNFDGMEDIAICNGQNGSYGAPSFNIYLSDRKAGKFAFNKPLTDVADQLGMFTVLKDKKLLEAFDKSGCCWHITARYKVVRDRPVKVWEETEDATIQDQDKIKITTKTLVAGKWKTKVKYVAR